jgi:transcriptional regulator with PAS, ATPase and Fis domain
MSTITMRIPAAEHAVPGTTVESDLLQFCSNLARGSMTRTLTRANLTSDGPAQSGPTLRMLFNSSKVVPDTTWDITSGSTELGRQPTSEQQLMLMGDPHLSRRHAVMERRGGRVWISDLQSRNGTFVNGNRVERTELKDGDVIRLSDTILMVRLDPYDTADSDIETIHGRSPAAAALRHFVHLVAPTDATAVLIGETGTGKGITATAIHAASARSGGPFVSVNCAAIPETLAESALFGHVAGAFTGARRDAKGYFRAADGGTLFLDEVGELPENVQAKLLHAIEERAVVPVGATSPVKCDVRFIAATTVNLEAAVATGKFRPDLYARLADLVLELPPLRTRREDILSLMDLFLSEHAPPMHPDLAEQLVLYPWPFNIRGLKTVATELEVRGQGRAYLEPDLIRHRLTVADPTITLDRPAPPVPNAKRSSPPTRDEIIASLREHRGVVADVGRAMGRSRKQVYRWLERFEIDPEDYRGS